MEYHDCKIGMKVKIVRPWPDYSDGWVNTWTREMEIIMEYDCIYTILNIGRSGIHLEGDERFAWPWQSLALVEGIDRFVFQYNEIVVRVTN